MVNAICQHLPFHLGANFSGSGEVRYNGRGTGDIHMSWQNSSVTNFFSCTSLHISLFLHAYAALRRRCRSGIHPTKIMPAVGSALRNSVKWKILTMLLVLVSMSCSPYFVWFHLIHLCIHQIWLIEVWLQGHREARFACWGQCTCGQTGGREWTRSYVLVIGRPWKILQLGLSRCFKGKNKMFSGKPYADEDGPRLWYCVHRNEVDPSWSILISLGQNWNPFVTKANRTAEEGPGRIASQNVIRLIAMWALTGLQHACARAWTCAPPWNSSNSWLQGASRCDREFCPPHLQLQTSRSWFGSSHWYTLISSRATSQERWARMWLAKGTARQWLLQAGLWRQRFFLASSLCIEVEYFWSSQTSLWCYAILWVFCAYATLRRLKAVKNLGMQMTLAHFVRSPSQKSSCANHPALRWAIGS